MEQIQMLPHGQVMTISPELARSMLATSPGNRDIREMRITIYRDAMKRGEWMVAQPIIFDRAGQLRDGHHRLQALIEADMTLDFLVVTGISEDAYRVMDVGLTRRMTDLVPHGRRLIEEATLLYQLAVGRSLRPTAHQMQAMCDHEWAQHSHRLREECPTNRRIFSSTPVRVAAIYWMRRAEYDRTDQSEVDYVVAQYRAVTLSDFESMSPQCRVFFRQASATNFGGGGAARNEMLVRALHAFWMRFRDYEYMRLGPKSMTTMLDMIRQDIPRLFNINNEQEHA